jgi:hypothetical protein
MILKPDFSSTRREARLSLAARACSGRVGGPRSVAGDHRGDHVAGDESAYLGEDVVAEQDDPGSPGVRGQPVEEPLDLDHAGIVAAMNPPVTPARASSTMTTAAPRGHPTPGQPADHRVQARGDEQRQADEHEHRARPDRQFQQRDGNGHPGRSRHPDEQRRAPVHRLAKPPQSAGFLSLLGGHLGRLLYWVRAAFFSLAPGRHSRQYTHCHGRPPGPLSSLLADPGSSPSHQRRQGERWCSASVTCLDLRGPRTMARSDK